MAASSVGLLEDIKAMGGGERDLRPVVLVVDDDVSLRRAMVAALDGPYQLLTATSGNEAIEILKRRPVHALLLDMVMVDGDGYSVLLFVRNMKHKPAVIINTVIDRVDCAVKVMQLGASDYVLKPASVGELRQAIDGAISSASAAPWD